MAHFIELHQNDKDNTPMLLNVDWIYCVMPNDNDNGSIIRFAIEQYLDSSRFASTQFTMVIESYSTIKQLLGW